jgi:hypothetical protein
MRERLTDPAASNWVDRGQAPEPELTRVLASYLGQDPVAPDVQLREHVTAIRGMVEADSTEVHLAGYLKQVERGYSFTEEDGRRRRTVAIALWHIAKCAEIRERARRLMDFGIQG